MRPVLLAALLFASQAGLATEIVVGQVAPQSGPDAKQARAYATGMQLMFAQANLAGGVNGNTFVLVRKEDGGRAEDAAKVTRQLLEERKPLVLAGYFGDRSIEAVLQSGLLEKERIALVGYRSTDLRADSPFLYNVRAGLNEEISRIGEHLGTLAIHRWGLLFEDGPAASVLVAAVDQAAKKANGTLVSQASYAPGTTRVGDAVDTMIKAAPQAIILVCSGPAAAKFIEQYRTGGGSAQLFVHSGADMEQVTKEISQDRLSFVSTFMQGVAISQVTPNPYKSATGIAKELNLAVLRAGKLEEPVGYVMMEGYLTAKVIVEAVRREGARPTREAIVRALEHLAGFDAGGYVVGFRPGMRTGSKYVELTIISGTGKVRE